MQYDKEQNHGRPKDPIASAHQQALRALEDATLSWLARLDGISKDYVLMCPRERSPWGIHDFYELDFIGGAPEFPSFIGELKHSSAPRSALRAARKQLRSRVAIGSRRWPELTGIGICFNMDNEMDWARPAKRLDEIREMLTNPCSPNVITVMEGRGKELMSRLASEGLLDSSFAEQFLGSFRMMMDPLSILKNETNNFSVAHAFDRAIKSASND